MVIDKVASSRLPRVSAIESGLRENYSGGVSVDVSTEPDGSMIVMVSRPVRELANA